MCAAFAERFTPHHNIFAFGVRPAAAGAKSFTKPVKHDAVPASDSSTFLINGV
jgi:hypothetical protein